MVLYACQQYIPKVFRPFFGYALRSEMSIIITWGKPGWESHILYINEKD